MQLYREVTDQRVFIFKRESSSIKSTTLVEYAASLRVIMGWSCTRPHPHMALLSSHLFVLQETGAGYVQSPRPCVMVRPPPWTRVWSPFRTMDSSSHLAMFSSLSPTNLATALDLRSVMTWWCDHFSSPRLFTLLYIIEDNNTDICFQQKTWKDCEFKRFWCMNCLKMKPFMVIFQTKSMWDLCCIAFQSEPFPPFQ